MTRVRRWLDGYRQALYAEHFASVPVCAGGCCAGKQVTS